MDRFYKRFRSSFVAGVLTVATLAVAALPAWAISLHNGLILVHNFSQAPIQVEVLTPFGHTWEGPETVQPGYMFISHKCCYAAGTQYRIYVRRLAGAAKEAEPAVNVYVTPKLCNRDGIPYGFAELVVDRQFVHGHGTQDHCYGGPL
jgi:hypothetical protein